MKINKKKILPSLTVSAATSSLGQIALRKCCVIVSQSEGWSFRFHVVSIGCHTRSLYCHVVSIDCHMGSLRHDNSPIQPGETGGN